MMDFHKKMLAAHKNHDRVVFLKARSIGMSHFTSTYGDKILEDKMKVDAPKVDGPSEEELKQWAGGLSLITAPGDMNSHEWIESLRVINCLEKEDFRQIFGESHGAYLWSKFVNDKDADVFEFLCYLDLQNGKDLYDYCLQRIRRKK